MTIQYHIETEDMYWKTILVLKIKHKELWLHLAIKQATFKSSQSMRQEEMYEKEKNEAYSFQDKVFFD